MVDDSNAIEDDPLWFMRTGTVRVAGVKVRWNLATFSMPVLVLASFGQFPTTVPVPGLGDLSRVEFSVLVSAALLALYVHEIAHVVAARAVGMPILHMALDSMIPAVLADDTNPASSDPTRRFWFAAGGPLGDLTCGTVAVLVGCFADGMLQHGLIGYGIGAGVQLLNALPTLAAGWVLLVIALCVGVTAPAWAAVWGSLGLAGAFLLALRLVRGSRHADGDLALAAWRQSRTPSNPLD